jgi:hypothetical protein
MKNILSLPSIFLLLVSLGFAATSRAAAWHISGELSEACTCSVPCTCNFGESPSPYSFCHAVVGMTIDKGQYDKVDLSGMKIAAAVGAKGFVFYIDDRAKPEQAEALKAIVKEIHRKFLAEITRLDPKAADDPSTSLIAIETATIKHEWNDKQSSVKIGDKGGFEADYLIGIDGKSPVRLQNNWSFNLVTNIKAKARAMKYQDAHGNEIAVEKVNSNEGAYDWSDQTPLYFR